MIASSLWDQPIARMLLNTSQDRQIDFQRLNSVSQRTRRRRTAVDRVEEGAGLADEQLVAFQRPVDDSVHGSSGRAMNRQRLLWYSNRAVPRSHTTAIVVSFGA